MNQHQQARNLYFQTEMKQADIASLVGISDRTLGRWIAQDNWKQMKTAAKQARIAIVEMLYKQLYALNSNICSRELPIPTMEEAEINRKLILSIDKLKQQASLSENIQVLMGFTTFLNKIDNQLSKQVVTYADQYLKEKKGYAPFGFYDEPEEEEEYPDEELEYDTADMSANVPDVPQTVIEKKVKRTTAIKTTAKKEQAQPHPQKAPAAQRETPTELKAVPTPSFPAGSPERDPAVPSQMTVQQKQHLHLQQQAKNAFFDEVRRFADSQFINKHRW